MCLTGEKFHTTPHVDAAGPQFISRQDSARASSTR